MENKSNSLNRIKRQQREKILRFSIRKYSFGAASVAVAALMFLGARVASADSVVPNAPQSNAGVVNPKDKVDSPEDVTESTANKVDEGHKSPENQVPAVPANSAPTVDKAKLRKVVEELNALLSTKLNLDESVVSPVKDRLQKGKEALESSELAQKDIDELAKLLSKDVTVVSAAKESTEVQVDKKVDKQVDKQADKTEKPADNLASQTSPEVSASEESQTVSAKKDALKVSVDQLKAAVLEVPEHETSKEVLEKANELLGLAQGVLENTTVSLNDVEDMTKRVKRMFNSVKNATTRLTSGARDPRNGKSMGQGTGGRAATVSSQWTKQDNLLIYQRFRATDFYGNIRNNDRQFTENKVDMTARTQMIDGQKYLVYDVFFNNDGRSMVNLSRQQLYNVILPPKILDLQSNGLYKSDTIRDLYFETYRRNNQNEGGTLSQNPDKFRYESTQHFHFKNDHDVSKGRLTYFYNVGVRQNNAYNQDMRDNFKNNKNDQFLKDAVALDGVYKQWSYGIGVKTNDPTAAVHMHFKAKLRPGVTDEAVQKAFTLAIAGTYGGTTNQSYVFGSGKKNEENVEPTLGEKQNKRYPIIGKEVTKTVGDSLEENPVASGLVTRDNGTKEFPDGMSWEFLNGKPNTNTAGVFKPQVKATYSDNSSNTTTATLIVKPKKPAITTSVENKKGLTGQQITVNVGSGVPKGSTVNLYDGNKIIGTVKTNGGETATVTVTEALPGKSITAVTVVTNTDGTVTSDKSNPVTPTEAPDTQKPTLEISRKSQTVVEGEKVTFTITARDNKVVTIEGKDFTDKYGDRLLSRQATNNKVKITDTEKVIEITITTKKEDVGGPHEITFGAHDDAGNKADPVKFTFNVTPRDNQKPIVEVGGIRLTENEPQSAQFYVYRGATFNPTVKAWDNSGNITSMSVENLPNGSKAQTYTPQTGKDGSTEDKKYTTSLSTGTVADTQTLGDHVAKFRISDGVNSAIYQMKYKVVDVVVENTPKTVELNSKSGDPNEYLNTAGKQDKSGKPVVESQADVHFPVGMKFRWDNANGSDTNITLSKVGTQTHKAIAVFPKNPSQRGSVQVFAPEKAERDVVFNVVDNEKPKASLNGKELSETANEPIFTVYRGATFNPELKVSDNSGVISKVEVKGGLPKGVTPDPGATPSTFTAQTGKDGSSEDKKYKTRLSSGTVLDTETLGVHESTIHVEGSNPSDSRDFKFKYRVVDIETKNVDKNGIAKVPVASTLNKDNSSKNIDAHNYLKVVDSQDKADRGNNYLPSGMTWTWKDRNGVNKDRGTTLDNSGKYTRTATAIFPGTKANNMTDDTSTTRDVFAPAEIKRKVILAVTPTAPTVEGKENGSVTITPPKQPDSTNQQDIDKITLTYTPTGQTSPETVTVTKSGSKWTVNGKSDDKVSVSPEGVVTISDAEIADKTEVTAKVSKNIDGVLTLESPVARGTANGPLAAEVTNPAPVPEKAPITPVTVVTPNKPGSSITVDGPVNGLTVDEEGKLKGKPEVNDWKPKEEERTVEIPVKVTKGGETVTVKVPVPILRDTDGDGIPDKEDSDDDNDGIPDEEEITNGTDPKTPTTQTPTIEITQQPNGNAIVTPKKPDGKPYPPGTKVEIPGKDGNPITVTIGEDGKGKVPNSELPEGKVPGTAKITEPGQPTVEVPVETPAKVTPETPTTEKPGKIEITQQPNGNAIVTPKKPDGSTYPPGTKVEIPGENGTTITVTIGDNGSGEVPNDNLPKKDVPGTGTVTEPNKKPSQPVDVTTPARKTPTVDVEQDPKTGDVTVTPKKPDGSTYPPGTKVEIPGENGPITVTIGEDGKGKVPNDNLPKTDVPGTGKITEPGRPSVEVPNVTTPGKFTPETPETEKPGKIEITQQPNGNAIVTPKKPDGSTYPSGSKVEIPGENGTTIIVTIGDNGSGEVPNDNLPKKDVPGTGTVTEPNKKPSQPVDVTTPARKTPTVELEQDPKTGDVTVTPKKPDGSTYPPGTKVEIPGKDGNPIKVTIGEGGKGKVPNSELPEGKVPGTAKIIEPGQPAVEVPDVTTPGKVTPSTPTDTNPVAPVTPDMPVKPDTNGDSGQDKPAPATPTPNADQVDTKTTVDNGAKSNDSQNVLPNTGTESNAALASLGLLGLLSGFGLVARKKKED